MGVIVILGLTVRGASIFSFDFKNRCRLDQINQESDATVQVRRGAPLEKRGEELNRRVVSLEASLRFIEWSRLVGQRTDAQTSSFSFSNRFPD
jgi:hypothetical protein